MLNAGHRRSGMAGRCVLKGNRQVTEEIPAFCAVALAGLGNIPDTILTRSIVVRMKRRGRNDKVEAFRRRVHEVEAQPLREELETLLGGIADQLQEAWPDMPEGVVDRDADVWEPLVAIADAAGGHLARAGACCGCCACCACQGKEPEPWASPAR
jgi:hypothetical protein